MFCFLRLKKRLGNFKLRRCGESGKQFFCFSPITMFPSWPRTIVSRKEKRSHLVNVDWLALEWMQARKIYNRIIIWDPIDTVWFIKILCKNCIIWIAYEGQMNSKNIQTKRKRVRANGKLDRGKKWPIVISASHIDPHMNKKIEFAFSIEPPGGPTTQLFTPSKWQTKIEFSAGKLWL